MVLWRDIPGAIEKVRSIGLARARRKMVLTKKLSQWDRQKRELFFFFWQAVYTVSTLGFGNALASPQSFGATAMTAATVTQEALTAAAITQGVGFMTGTIPLMANGTLTRNERIAQIAGAAAGVAGHKGLNWLFDPSTLSTFDNIVTDQILGNPNIMQRGGAIKAILFPWWQIAFGF